jgi:hypothetical protein
VIVKKGLKEGTTIYLALQENAESFKLKGQELIPEIKKAFYEEALQTWHLPGRLCC